MARWSAIGAVFLSVTCALTTGCGGGGLVGIGPAKIREWPLGRFEKPSTAQPIVLADSIALDIDINMPSIVAVRSTLNSGAFELVTTLDGAEFSRRRIERIGENLSILPLPVARSGSISIYQAENAGPLDVAFATAEITNFMHEEIASFATDLASRFESETGQLADPLVENLVPNASFAADDEVRGTPADWFAYVETTSNVLERRLRATGIAPGRRPFLATGPIRVESGRRYRVLVRLTVHLGAVALRIADYEELRVLVDLGTVSAADGPVERRVDFMASDVDRAARIRFEPATPGERADFELSAIQMEVLP